MKGVRPFMERVTHWQEGKPDRHDAMLALLGLEDDLQQALALVDRIRQARPVEVTDERAMLRRAAAKQSQRRAYTLKDAKRDAESAAAHLRRAWEYLDPST